jgi:L-threonylcarbamoyladenylate synthase
VVAFPTETVYGLGADARNSTAVRTVFDIKGRPSTNPVIVHVADTEIARRYAAAFPPGAARLAERFWPGPLTIVLAKTDAIVPEVTAGLGTVGLRAPDHPLTLELLRKFDGPLIGPSANRSTHVSPTTAQHVREELGDAVKTILDGGPCRVGIESTVLDLSGATPTILRPGAVSREQIEQILGAPVVLKRMIAEESAPATAPGQQPVHYSPRTLTYRFARDQLNQVRQLMTQARGGTMIVIWLGKAPDGVPAEHTMNQLEMPDNPRDYARQVYSTLRHADARSLGSIWIEMPPDEPQWVAIRDRLMRASRPAPSSR